MVDSSSKGRYTRLAHGVAQRLDIFSEKFSMNLDGKGTSSHPSIIGCILSLCIIASLSIFASYRAISVLGLDRQHNYSTVREQYYKEDDIFGH